jgi:hypothetical protein
MKRVMSCGFVVVAVMCALGCAATRVPASETKAQREEKIARLMWEYEKKFNEAEKAQHYMLH